MVLEQNDLRREVPRSSQVSDESWTQTSSIVDRAIQQVRSMSHLLHPPLLDEVGLLSALAWYVEGLSKRSGIETTLDVQPEDFPETRRGGGDRSFSNCARSSDQRLPAFRSHEGVRSR